MRSSRSCWRPTASACATCWTCRACRTCSASCTRASSVDGMHDVLRRIGDLTLDEARLRTAPGHDAEAWLEQLENERRAMRVRLNGELRWAAAEDAGLLRDALGAVPPSGLPEAFV